MRSKMLGLAIALSTFGLGVAVTTLWIAYSTPAVSNLPAPPAAVATDFAPAARAGTDDAPAPCFVMGSALSQPTTLKVGRLNDRAINWPHPVYPAAGTKARPEGAVVVEVLVDECGRVTSARAVSGHPLLRGPSVTAAYKTRFAPTESNGQPVRLKGTLVYNFVLL